MHVFRTLDTHYFYFFIFFFEGERLPQDLTFFVTRSKSNTLFKRIYSNKTDRTTGIIADQTIRFDSLKALADYPDKLRRIVYRDSLTKKKLVFFTNNFKISAKTIAELYKARWQIELFFKWIKQHLKIKSFFGTSENTVRSQIWIAVTTYLLVAIVKKQLSIQQSLYSILQTLSVTPFEKTPILQAFSHPFNSELQNSSLNNPNQLNLLLS